VISVAEEKKAVAQKALHRANQVPTCLTLGFRVQGLGSRLA
jgi:hypothetical protein